MIASLCGHFVLLLASQVSETFAFLSVFLRLLGTTVRAFFGVESLPRAYLVNVQCGVKGGLWLQQCPFPFSVDGLRMRYASDAPATPS